MKAQDPSKFLLKLEKSFKNLRRDTSESLIKTDQHSPKHLQHRLFTNDLKNLEQILDTTSLHLGVQMPDMKMFTSPKNI